MAGWYRSKSKLEIIVNSDADIICLAETHLQRDESITLEGYTWFGHNRLQIHRNAIRGSGGVGILIKNSIFESYSVAVVNQDYEDISLIHNRSLESVGLCVCYLPPSNSSRGDNSLEFFNVLKMLVLKMQMYDAFMLCGDFNARCSNKSDTDTSLCPTNLPVRRGVFIRWTGMTTGLPEWTTGILEWTTGTLEWTTGTCLSQV